MATKGGEREMWMGFCAKWDRCKKAVKEKKDLKEGKLHGWHWR